MSPSCYLRSRSLPPTPNRRTQRRQWNLSLKEKDYTLNQIRYDLRKIRLHGLIERIPHSYAYHFTQRGQKLALLLIQLRKRIYEPIAFGTLHHRPNKDHMPDSTFACAYHKNDQAFDEAIHLLAA